MFPAAQAWRCQCLSVLRITECSELEGTSVGHPVQPLLKQGRLQQAAEDLVQAGLEYLQRRRLHSLPGQPGPGLHRPQREEILPHVHLELPLLQFVPVAPCPVTGHHWKEKPTEMLPVETSGWQTISSSHSRFADAFCF